MVSQLVCFGLLWFVDDKIGPFFFFFFFFFSLSISSFRYFSFLFLFFFFSLLLIPSPSEVFVSWNPFFFFLYISQGNIDIMVFPEL